LKFLQVFLALDRICATAASPRSRSRSVKPTTEGVARFETSFCTMSTMPLPT